MQRGTATVVFTDIVGSTELLVAHGERYDVARRAHDGALRAAMEEWGGTVVKGTGDGLMCLFDAAGDAVAAARAGQQAIDRLGRAAAPALSIRIGIAAGDVTREGDDCFGEAVVAAARVCGAASGGRILATRLVRDLVGARAEGFEPVGAVELKGLPDPVDLFELSWEVATVDALVPLPARLADPVESFVGRTHELGRLHGALGAVVEHGRRRIVLVSGEAGAGKTTVLGEAARAWHRDGASVAVGRCEEHVRSPYRPFMEALDQLVASVPVELLEGHVARHGDRIAALVPRLRSRIDGLAAAPRTDPETERYLLFAAVADLLDGLGAARPLVLLLEDLHWVDEASAALLASLAAERTESRLLVLCTFRHDEITGGHPMAQVLGDLRRVDWVDRVPVGGLRREDVLALLERWTGHAGTEREHLAEWLLAETDGNAFFVTEVMRHLDETGRLDSLDGLRGDRTALLPESIREVLGGRVARLGSTAESVLATAAVIGSEFDLPLLSGVTGLDDAKLVDILADAAGAALVREVPDAPGRYVFVHALVQHAMLVLLGPTRTASLHRRVAEQLEAGGDLARSLDALAHHWIRATQVSDTARARDWTRLAGEAALAHLAPADAVGYLRQALDLHDRVSDGDVATRIDLLTVLGTAQRQASDAGYRETLLEACRLALTAGDADRLADAALANNIGTFSTFQGVDADRVAMLEAAIAGARVAPDKQALLRATLANELTYSGNLERRRRIADEAVRIARDVGDPALLVRVLNLIFFALWVPDTLPERLALTEESLAICGATDDPALRYWAGKSAYLNLVQAGRLADADRLLDEIGAIADRFAQPALQWRVVHTRATRRLLAGDHAGAEVLAEEAASFGRRAGAPEAEVYLKSQQMFVHWLRGTLAGLAQRIDGRSTRPISARSSLCLIFASGGRDADAARILDDVAVGALAGLPRDPAYVAAIASLAEGAIRLGHRDAAVELRDHVAPMVDQVGFDGVTTVGGLWHYAGGLDLVLDDVDDAVLRLERSAAWHGDHRAPFFEARSRHLLAVALRRRGAAGDGEAAVRELERAAALADAHGFEGVRRDIGALAADDQGGG